MALHQGLDGAIINPLSRAMMGAYRSYRALMGLDDQCQEYMEAFREEAPASLPPRPQRGEVTLHQAVCRGLKEGAAAQAKALADQGREILDIINGELVPALDQVGQGFEKGHPLPAPAAHERRGRQGGLWGFERVPSRQPEQRRAPDHPGDGQGDIHDIGKNIVKLLLENYGFRVLDLGKDVAPETIVEAVRAKDIPLVGLSALMTTTTPLHGGDHPPAAPERPAL